MTSLPTLPYAVPPQAPSDGAGRRTPQQTCRCQIAHIDTSRTPPYINFLPFMQSIKALSACKPQTTERRLMQQPVDRLAKGATPFPNTPPANGDAAGVTTAKSLSSTKRCHPELLCTACICAQISMLTCRMPSPSPAYRKRQSPWVLHALPMCACPYIPCHVTQVALKQAQSTA